MTSGSAQDARQRSGQTKRARSREVLVSAAADVFRRGWLGARMEDIARQAGVSTATAYNHFPGGKQELMGVVYAPLVEPLVEAAQADIAARLEPVAALIRNVRATAELARREQQLTTSLIAAVTEQIIRVGRPPVPDSNDVRILVPFTAPLTWLVAYGQEQGVFRSDVPPYDIASYHLNALLQRVFSRPHESAEETAELVLSQLLPSLTSVASS